MLLAEILRVADSSEAERTELSTDIDDIPSHHPVSHKQGHLQPAKPLDSNSSASRGCFGRDSDLTIGMDTEGYDSNSEGTRRCPNSLRRDSLGEETPPMSLSLPSAALEISRRIRWISLQTSPWYLAESTFSSIYGAVKA